VTEGHVLDSAWFNVWSL